MLLFRSLYIYCLCMVQRTTCENCFSHAMQIVETVIRLGSSYFLARSYEYPMVFEMASRYVHQRSLKFMRLLILCTSYAYKCFILSWLFEKDHTHFAITRLCLEGEVTLIFILKIINGVLERFLSG